eukprot:scaffold51698_cov31-Tisochrysis_lutea.AAC.2
MRAEKGCAGRQESGSRDTIQSGCSVRGTPPSSGFFPPPLSLHSVLPPTYFRLPLPPPRVSVSAPRSQTTANGMQPMLMAAWSKSKENGSGLRLRCDSAEGQLKSWASILVMIPSLFKEHKKLGRTCKRYWDRGRGGEHTGTGKADRNKRVSIQEMSGRVYVDRENGGTWMMGV